MIANNEKNLKRMSELLKSQIVYDHLLKLMGIKPHLVRKLPVERLDRATYDQTRPEIQSLNAITAKHLAFKIQSKEKEELTLLLKSAALLRYQAAMQALIDYAVHVDMKEFERNLQAVTPHAQYCCGGAVPHKIPANRIREY